MPSEARQLCITEVRETIDSSLALARMGSLGRRSE